jgi:hypothetical protein
MLLTVGGMACRLCGSDTAHKVLTGQRGSEPRFDWMGWQPCTVLVDWVG